MAKCYNKNLPEYQSLSEEFKDNMVVDSLIEKWQSLNNSEEFPTVEQAKQVQEELNMSFSLKTKAFTDALIANLVRNKIIHYSEKYGGYYLNNTRDGEMIGNPKSLKINYNRLLGYLDKNKIPRDVIDDTITRRSRRIFINEDALMPVDVLPKSRRAAGTHTVDVLSHIQKMFPGLRMKVLSAKEAENLYDTLPAYQKNKTPFTQVRSFYVNQTAVLIKGRVTHDIAIEEVLHPFIDAVYVDNPELFKTLYDEAAANFPVLKQEIDQAYNTKYRKFSETHRQLELVTQALTRYFSNEFENTPTKSFKDKINEFLNWFLGVIKNLHEVYTGGTAKLKVDKIKPGSNLSDIAKLLNTSELQFILEKKVDSKIRYSLSEEKQTALDQIRRNANDAQKIVLDKLFHAAQQRKGETPTFSAGKKDVGNNDDIVILNEKNHTYYNLKDLSIEYVSSTTAIGGKMENLDDVELNLAVGNDFDNIAEAIVLGKSLADVKEAGMQILTDEQLTRAYYSMEGYIKAITNDGDILVPQVVVHGENADGVNIAGTIDLLAITPQGKLKILDLKTSKNRLSTSEDGKYNTKWDLKDDSLLKAYGVKTLSTKQKHNLQVNLYRRMLENMGYEVDASEQGASTHHLWVDITGKGKDQKFNGNFEIENVVFHPLNQNEPYVNALVPKKVNKQSKAELENLLNETDTAIEKFDSQDLSDVNDMDITGPTEFGGLEQNMYIGAIKEYRKSLTTRRDVIETVKSAVYMDRTKEDAIERLSTNIALTTVALTETGEAPRVFTELLLDIKKELEEYEKFLLNPENASNPLYLTRARNYENFIKTFEGLYKLPSIAGLNRTQKDIILQIQNTLNRLGESTSEKQSVIDEAIFTHVKAIVRENSSKDFAPYVDPITGEVVDPFEDLFHSVIEDMSLTDYLTRDTNTAEDTLIALMKKMWHAKRQEVLDRIEERKSFVLYASRLAKLSPGKNPKEIYEFMIELDENGVHTGELVKKIGPQYYDKFNALYKSLRDSNGEMIMYKPIGDISKAKPEDIAFNQELYRKKQEYRKFMQAEVVNDDGTTETGEYHKYNSEFIAARNKNEIQLSSGRWVYNGSKGKEQEMYYNKYYNVVKYNQAIMKDGVFTGKVVEKEGTFPKKEYVEILETSKSGQIMTSDKYRAIMDAPQTDALASARKAYYIAYTALWKDLNDKLPDGVGSYMYGKSPRVRGNFSSYAKNKPTGVKALWAATKTNTKEFFSTTTRLTKVNVNEKGEMVDGIPIMYTGNLRQAEDVEAIENKIAELKKQYGNSTAATSTSYSRKLQKLESELVAVRSKPAAEELSYDLTEAIMKYAAMAENYEVMSGIEETMLAFQEVINKREYSKRVTTVKKVARKAKKLTGGRNVDDTPADQKARNTKKAAEKFMEMVFYDSDDLTKNQYEKIIDSVLGWTSLSYVAFNVFGNFNNYVIARVNNGIEVMGQRFFARDAYIRASKEFNTRAIPDFIRRTSHDVTAVRSSGRYDPYEPTSKFEGFVDLFRMMDNKGDLRESGGVTDRTGKSYYDRFKEFGYLLQDAAEYNVQTKIGMAIVMDTYILNKDTGEILSLYDAFEFNGDQKLELKEGFTTIIKPKKEIPTFKQALKGNNIKKDEQGNMLYDEVGEYNSKFRYDLRMKIREVNKQIHGNYAAEDKVVLQQYYIGKLLFQFHKWVAPAIRARYQREYFDENLGWMEGRIRSWLSFVSYMGKAGLGKLKGDLNKGMTVQGYMDSIARLNDDKEISESERQRLENKILNVHRFNGELATIGLTFLIINLFDSILLSDDDDSDFVKKLKNIARYQADRTKKELLIFTPSISLITQGVEFFDSPFAVTRTLGEIGGLMDASWDYGTNGIKYMVTGNEDDWYYNKDVFYQRGRRTGKLKVGKELMDIVPILYTIKKWDDYIQLNNFFIK